MTPSNILEVVLLEVFYKTYGSHLMMVLLISCITLAQPYNANGRFFLNQYFPVPCCVELLWPTSQAVQVWGHTEPPYWLSYNAVSSLIRCLEMHPRWQDCIRSVWLLSLPSKVMWRSLQFGIVLCCALPCTSHIKINYLHTWWPLLLSPTKGHLEGKHVPYFKTNVSWRQPSFNIVLIYIFNLTS